MRQCLLCLCLQRFHFSRADLSALVCLCGEGSGKPRPDGSTQMTAQVWFVNQAAPACPKCHSPMLLRRLLPRRYSYNGQFECDACGCTLTTNIGLALTASPPLVFDPSQPEKT